MRSSSNTSYISYEEVYSLQMIHAWFYGITPIPPYILSSLISPFHVFLRRRRRPPECGICMSQISRSRFSSFPPSASSPSSSSPSPPSFVFVSLSNALLLPFLVAGTSSGHREAPPRHTQIHHDRTESQLIPGGHPHSGGKSASRVSLISERARCIPFIRSLLNQILFLPRGH